MYFNKKTNELLYNFNLICYTQKVIDDLIHVLNMEICEVEKPISNENLKTITFILLALKRRDNGWPA